MDLSTAFHHLVRELVVGVGDDDLYGRGLEALDAAQTPLEAASHGHRLIGILEKAHLDPLLLRLLRDAHQATWFSLAGQHIVQTHRGTRPGSPIADAVFHILMSDIAADLRSWLLCQDDYIRLLDRLRLPPIMVIWSDDLAVPLISASASGLVESVTSAMRETTQLFRARGVKVNFAPGKTSAVLTFAGKDAPALRRAHLLGTSPGVAVAAGEGRTAWLCFTSSYKHLVRCSPPTIRWNLNCDNESEWHELHSAKPHGWS